MCQSGLFLFFFFFVPAKPLIPGPCSPLHISSILNIDSIETGISASISGSVHVFRRGTGGEISFPRWRCKCFHSFSNLFKHQFRISCVRYYGISCVPRSQKICAQPARRLR
ncbi:hypothetical protein IWX90DRAFT_101796 [Phyllosticta citrichinensis]|uniref:Secreted protein n=1 Tax=Phyllosticta citrichinensis TaxID=1130410 RepID=A0ABR1Y1X9_9PEZI